MTDTTKEQQISCKRSLVTMHETHVLSKRHRAAELYFVTADTKTQHEQ